MHEGFFRGLLPIKKKSHLFKVIQRQQQQRICSTAVTLAVLEFWLLLSLANPRLEQQQEQLLTREKNSPVSETEKVS